MKGKTSLVASGWLVGLCLTAPAWSDVKAPLRVRENLLTRHGTAIELDQRAYELLSGYGNVRLTDFPISPDEFVALELERFWILSPDTEIVEGTDDGDVALPHPDVALFRGRVSGQSGLAFLSVSPFGMNALLEIDDRLHILSARVDRGVGDDVAHVVYDAAEAFAGSGPAEFNCEVVTPSASVTQHRSAVPPPETSPQGGAFRVGFIALDADFQFSENFQSTSAATTYMVELLAAVSTIYERDVNLKLIPSFLRVWTTSNDPYDQCDSGDCTLGDVINEFGVYWEANQIGTERNVAHLLSGKVLGGGIATLEGACLPFVGYGVNGDMTGAFPRPPENGDDENWDVIVLAHELGHNFGTHHTHCYVAPLDACYNDEEGCYQGATDCQPGTLMSYCHLCGSANESAIDLEFHPVVQSRIEDYLDGSCIRVARNPAYVDHRNGGFEDGTLTYPYRKVLGGVRIVIPDAPVSIYTGNYDETFTIVQPMTLEARGGTVVIGQ